MDWVLILFFGGLLCMILAISALLLSLAKQGDERKNFIKSKAISQTFMITICVLIIEIGNALYTGFIKGEKMVGTNPFTLLFVLSIVFFVSLLINKKKYGD